MREGKWLLAFESNYPVAQSDSTKSLNYKNIAYERDHVLSFNNSTSESLEDVDN